MKDYEIAHQGSRFVVKTLKGSDGSNVVSAPFHTHAAAQEYIDQQRAAQNSEHGGLEKSKKEIADAESFETAGSKFGVTAYEGKQYVLTSAPSFAGVYGLGISADNYSALCIDTNGKEYTAFFEVLENDPVTGAFADWENASLVKRG